MRGLNCSLSVVCDASETLQNKWFLKQNLIEFGASFREAKSSSLLAFLRPPLREAAERSSSLKGWSKKRYWANVSEVFFQSHDATTRFLRKVKREMGLSLARRPRRGVSLRILARERRFCRRLSRPFCRAG